MLSSRLACAAILMSLLLFGTSNLHSQQPVQGTALWVAESAGALKLSGTDGHLLFAIGDLSARAIAVDHRHAVVWYYANRRLNSYLFNGAKQFSVPLTNLPISLPLLDVPETDLAVFEDDGSVWLAVGTNLLSLSSSGQLLHTLRLSESIESLSIDRSHGILWVATSHAIAAYDAVTGSVIRSIPVVGAQSVDVDPLTSTLWVAWRDGIRAYSFDGSLLKQISLSHPLHVSADLRGGAWVATATELRRLGASGQTLVTLRPFGILESIAALAVDPSTDSLWAASEFQVAQVNAVGQRLRIFSFAPPVRIWDLAFYADIIPPALAIRAPLDGAYISTPRPVLAFDWSDVGTGVDPSSLAIQWNGSPFATSCTSNDSGGTCTALNSMPDGLLTLSATVKDRAGNTSDPKVVSFTIDTLPPTILVTEPTNGALTNQRNISFVGRLNEAGTVTINGSPVTLASDNSFSGSVALQEGNNSVLIVAKDRAGNTSQSSVSIKLDTVPPAAVDPGRLTVAANGNGSVTVAAPAGSAEPGATVSIVNTRTGVTITTTAGSDGSFTASVTGQAGDGLSIVISDAAGNRSPAATISVPGAPQDGLPPDPATVAPVLDRTVATDIASATAFLYNGNSPIQTGVTPGTIDPKRLAVLRGHIGDRNGFPVTGVKISIVGHGELGSTLSRTDGAYDLAVNGGGVLSLAFEKAGYLTIQRQVNAPWRDYVAVEDAVMVRLDTAVSTLSSAAQTLQVAQGSIASDADGERRATLLFPAGVTATLVLPDGSRTPLSNFSVRATEYTVGETGPRAMPGPLPATVGYTWAAEFSVDEAISAGAERVEFSAPVIVYVNNFLHFQTGNIVPVGFYDRISAAWIGSPNGRVVAILGRDSSGRALLDLDGSGQPAADDALEALAVSDDERQKLGALFEPGQSFWRAPVTHFSPFDLNFPAEPPLDAIAPPGDDQAQDEGAKDDDNDCTGGSIIECQSQILGERVNIVGTPFTLNYRSDGVPGRTALYTAKLNVSGPTVPASLKRIDLEIDIAGRSIRQSFPPQPNQTYTFTWDGKDAYGRLVQGSLPLTIKKAYVYNLLYLKAGEASTSWDLYPDASYTVLGNPRQNAEVYISRTRVQSWVQEPSRASLGGWDSRALGLGGWRLDVHHSYDPNSHTLYLGSGERRSAFSLSPLLYRMVGTGEGGYGGDGGPASSAMVADPSGISISSDGTLYIADQGNHRVRRVSPEGIITTIAGDGVPCGPNLEGGAAECGDGGQAMSAHLRSPQAVAVSSDGSVLIADTGNNCVRRVDLSGRISTAAGTCDGGGLGVGTIVAHKSTGQPRRDKAITCEGCLGTEISLKSPIDLAIAPDGGVYIADFEHDRILHLDSSGRISTTAGGGNPSDGLGDGGSARDAEVFHPQGISIARDGSLYIAQPYQDLVRRVAPDGRISTVAGSGEDGYCGDGGPATSACLSLPSRVAATPDGGFIIADTNSWLVRRVSPDGLISTISGTAEDRPDFTANGSAATGVFLEPLEAIAVAPDGSFYLATPESVFRQSRALPSFTTGQITIPAQDGSEVYVFNSSGKHLQTIDPLTHAVLYAFSYDDNGLLSSIQNVYGKLTKIERAVTGAPSAVITPLGQRTDLQLDGNGYLSQMKNPAGERLLFSYDSNGLLQSSRDGRGAESDYEYFGLGSLSQAKDRVDATKTLLRTNGTSGQYFVDLTSGMSRQTHYQIQRFEDGSLFTARREPSGEVTTYQSEQDGSQRTDLPDGSSATLIPLPDPRWGLVGSPMGSLQLLTPSGLSMLVSAKRTVLLNNPDDPLALSSISDTVNVNGREFLSTYDATSRKMTLRTPEGREKHLGLDENGRTITIQVDGLAPLEFGYDDFGRLVSAARGSGEERRTVTLSYNDKGWLETVSSPLSQTVHFEHDDAGRILSGTYADGRAVSLSYDLNGNLTSITPPGKSAHLFGFTPVDLLGSYAPPSLGSEPTSSTYSYNLDQQLTRVSRPDGRSIDLGYDTGGRLATVSLSEGTLQLSYEPGTGRLASVGSPGGETVSYAYDGPLPIATSWSGSVSGVVSRVFDDNLRVISTLVNRANPILSQYDRDNFLVQTGSLTLQRNPGNGLLLGTTLDEVVTNQGYNGFDELAELKATFGSSSFSEANYFRDQRGRITEKIETINNVTEVLDYGYDSTGRLSDVVKNGGSFEHYEYDDNGNRTSEVTSFGAVTSTYDAQDRLLQHGDVAYTYSANGELTTKSQGGALITYTYDEVGNLRKVDLPNNLSIEYIIDGRNRRVGKRVNGTLIQGFLYNSRLSPIAELAGDGSVVSRFVYGGQPYVPDYLVKGGVSYRIISDHLGSPRLIVNSETGEIIQRLDYNAFGRVILDTNPGFQPFGFAGGLYDYQTGLVRFGARDYDAETGRWTEKDPLLFRGGSTNVYHYCSGDPVNWIDPDGLNNRKPGKTPPSSWPPPPPSVVGKKPRWNPDGYWEGKGGRKCTWDSRSHGAGVDRGQGEQDGHWDDETSDNRWDKEGSPLPGSPDLQTAKRDLQWGLIAAGGAIIVGTLIEDVLTGGVGILDDPETLAAGGALIWSGVGH